MSKTIVVTGVTGIQVRDCTTNHIHDGTLDAYFVQGSSVAKTFLHLPGWKIRGITRNPSSPAAQAHAANGVEIVKGDLDDKQSLLPAFEGATIIFSNTDFFQHLWSKDTPSDGKAALKYAFDREVEQGVNIAEAAASPSVLETLDLFIFSSLADARKWSRGKYPNIYHNDAKTEIHKAIETRFPKLAARMSILQIGHYVTNWHRFRPLQPQKQPDGSFVVQRTFSPDFKMPFIIEHEDTGLFVRGLVDLPPKTNILGVSEYMSWAEWTKLWGEVMGVKTTFKQVSDDEFFEDAPAAMKEEFVETFAFIEEFGFTGSDPEVVSLDQVSLISMFLRV